MANSPPDPGRPQTPNEAATKLCTRLFADQEVLQSACSDHCADHTFSSTADARECAFQFARTTREVAPLAVDDHTVAWTVLLMLILIPIGVLALKRFSKKTE